MTNAYSVTLDIGLTPTIEQLEDLAERAGAVAVLPDRFTITVTTDAVTPIEAGETTIRELARMLPGTDVQAAVHALEVLTVAEAERRSAVPAS